MNEKKSLIFNENLPNLKLVRAKGNVSTELDGETVILDIASGVYSGLNEIGTRIWDLLEKPISIAALRDELLAEYDVTPEQCIIELTAFLNKLIEESLIYIESEEPC